MVLEQYSSDIPKKAKHIEGLTCFRCGAHTVHKISEVMGTLEISYFMCGKCLSTWYDNSDVVALIAFLKEKREPVKIG
jgi:transcription elongation factor Elf1